MPVICLSQYLIKLPLIVRLTFFWLFAYHLNQVSAQNTNIAIQRLTVEDGLSSDNVFCIYQDSKGLIWLGTSAGLNRYDGYNVEVIDIFNTDNLTNNKVYSVMEDNDGNLWLGTDFGINVLDQNHQVIKTYQRNDKVSSISDNRIRVIKMGSDSTIWIGTCNGTLDKYLGESKFQTVYRSNFIKDRQTYGEGDIYNPVLSMHEDATGYMWLRQYSGVFLRSARPLNIYIAGEKPDWVMLPDSIIGLGLDNDQMAWALARQSILKFDYKKGHFQTSRSTSGGLDIEMADLFARSKSGNFWVLSKRDFGELDVNMANLTYSSDELTKRGGTQLLNNGFVDLTGSIWVGTANNGVGIVSVRPTDFSKVYDKNTSSTRSDNSYGIVEAEDGNIYFHSSGVIRRLNPLTTEMRNMLEMDGINFQLIDDGKWIWTANSVLGLCKIDKRNWTVESFGLPSKEYFHTVLRSSSGDLFAGTGTGLFKFNEEKNEFESVFRSVVRILKVIESKDEHIWAATSKGLYKLSQDGKLLQHYTLTDFAQRGLRTVYLHTIFEGENGVLWLGSESGGVISFDPELDEFTHYTRTDGLSNNNIKAIAEHSGYLWISTQNGLSSFDINQKTFANYYTEDGLSDNTFNTNSVLRTSDNQLYFGGIKELVTFDPITVNASTQESEDANDTPLLLTSFSKLDGSTAKVVNLLPLFNEVNQEVSFNYRDRNIKLSFALADYNNSTKNQFAYKLDGLDENWLSLGNQNTIDFPTLPYGQYRLKVKSANAKGIWSRHELSIPIHMNRVFYKSPLFIFIGLVFAFIATYMFFRIRLIRLRKTQIKQERIIQDRTRQIREQKEEIEQDKLTIEQQAETLKEFNAVQTRWFTNIAHELRTPLTLILGPIRQFLSTSADYDVESVKKIKQAERSSVALLRLVNEILDVSKLEANQLELETSATNLNQLIKETVAHFDSLAREKGVGLILEFCVDIDLNIDKNRIQNIFINLVSNALKYTHQGGELKVKVDHKAEQGVAISFEDTGDGIHENDLPHVFERYYQTSDDNRMNQGGSGIGLALSQELAHLHGGKLSVTSELRKGSTFVLHLPNELVLNNNKQAAPQIEIGIDSKENADESIAEIGDERVMENQLPLVLLVEDNLDMRNYIRDLLSSTYHLLEASNGIEALKILDKHHPDLIISDVMMPKMDGLEFAKRVKQDEQLRYIPFITLTAKATDADKVETLRIGVDDYLTKPFNAEELLVRSNNLILNAFERSQTEGTASEGEEPASHVQELILKLEEEVKKRIDDKQLSVYQLADLVGMSERTLRRFLKKETGLSPNLFIREIKLKKAMQLLENRVHPTVAEVSFAVGFEKPGYFSLIFNNRFGKKPSEYLSEGSK